MTTWYSSALASSVAFCTRMWEEGELCFSMDGVYKLGYRCMKRNVTDEEIGLTVKKGCYLLPLEEWQVTSRSWSHVLKQVNDTFRNGSILHLETKQLFELGEYEMYRMEGLTRQGYGGGIFLGIGCAAIPSRAKRLSALTGSRDACPHICPHLGWASMFSDNFSSSSVWFVSFSTCSCTAG